MGLITGTVGVAEVVVVDVVLVLDVVVVEENVVEALVEMCVEVVLVLGVELVVADDEVLLGILVPILLQMEDKFVVSLNAST